MPLIMRSVDLNSLISCTMFKKDTETDSVYKRVKVSHFCLNCNTGNSYSKEVGHRVQTNCQVWPHCGGGGKTGRPQRPTQPATTSQAPAACSSGPTHTIGGLMSNMPKEFGDLSTLAKISLFDTSFRHIRRIDWQAQKGVLQSKSCIWSGWCNSVVLIS